MVEVRFACIPSLGGVACTIDGITKISNEIGIASFFDISKGKHTYSVKSPSGWVFKNGNDPFNRPLFRSGTTTIEDSYPENQPWLMAMTFEEGTDPPTSSGAIKLAIPAIVGTALIMLGLSK